MKIVAIFFAFVAFIMLVLLTTNFHLGVTADSMNYIEVAQNFFQGKGITNNQGVIVTHWPPLYPMLLGVFTGITTLNILHSSIYLNALLLAFTFLIFNDILNLLKIKNIVAILFLNVVLLFSVALNVYSWLLSEGLFIFLLLLLFHQFLKWNITSKKQLLVVAGILASLLFLTRYAAIGFIGGFLIYLMFFQLKRIKERILNLAFFMLPMVPLVAIWFVYAAGSTAGVVNRKIFFHPFSARNILSLGKTMLAWLIPFQSNLAIFISGLIIFSLGILLIFWFKYRGSPIISDISHVLKSHQITLCLIITYISFLLVSISFLDAHTPLDNRILSPVYPLLLFLFAPIMDKIVSGNYYKKPSFIFSCVILFLMLINSVRSWTNVYTEGQGITGKNFANSATLHHISTLKNTKIYTNGQDLITLYYPEKQDLLFSIPNWTDPGTDEKNSSFATELEQLKLSILNGDGRLVYFDNINWRFYLVPRDTLLIIFEHQKISNMADGFIISK